MQVDLWVKASVGEEKSVRREGGALVTKEGYVEVVGVCVISNFRSEGSATADEVNGCGLTTVGVYGTFAHTLKPTNEPPPGNSN